MTILRLILGDQLNHQHSWIREVDDRVVYLMMEMRQETDYAVHHVQKIIGFFSAMRQFAKHLDQRGHRVIYLTLDDEQNLQNLGDNLDQVIKEVGATCFQYQLPDEYRLDQMLANYCRSLDIESSSFETEHFLTRREFVAGFFEGRENWLMESFYRFMRREYDLLMDGDRPLGGRWNFDQENRKKIPAGHEPVNPLVFKRDVTALAEMVEEAEVKTIGNVNPVEFPWPTNRSQCLELLDFFTERCLPLFGTYQDAMSPDYWSLYHSRLSFAMNTKLLSPLEVVKKAIIRHETDPKLVSLSQIEGFVRQIVGWREYMRGVYWAKMPDYGKLNFLSHERELPGWFWNGETKMACVRHAITQSLDYGYAHHIQRLMVTGNFALLAGLDPDQVDAWYLGIYIDAIEWVEITNTRGMSQFADGGIVGTKPYVSSANYIHKMSHYCRQCHYNHRERTGDKSCPFNSLYWDFHDRHRDKLANNPRIGMTYGTLDRMAPDKKASIKKRASQVLENLEAL